MAASLDLAIRVYDLVAQEVRLTLHRPLRA